MLCLLSALLALSAAFCAAPFEGLLCFLCFALSASQGDLELMEHARPHRAGELFGRLINAQKVVTDHFAQIVTTGEHPPGWQKLSGEVLIFPGDATRGFLIDREWLWALRFTMNERAPGENVIVRYQSAIGCRIARTEALETEVRRAVAALQEARAAAMSASTLGNGQ
jgi:hypothetical protein